MAMDSGPLSGMAGARRGAISRLDSLGLGNAGAPAEGEGKQALGDVNYRAATGPERSCGECAHFTPPDRCELVAGYIDPGAVCDLFEPESGEQGPADQAEDRAPGGPPEPGPPPMMGAR